MAKMLMETRGPGDVGPFGGMRPRPYSQEEIVLPIRWWELEPRTVWFKDLILTQDKLVIAGLFGERYSIDMFPRIVVWRGEQFVEDGHHRLVLDALNNQESAIARVLFT